MTLARSPRRWSCLPSTRGSSRNERKLLSKRADAEVTCPHTRAMLKPSPNACLCHCTMAAALDKASTGNSSRECLPPYRKSRRSLVCCFLRGGALSSGDGKASLLRLRPFPVFVALTLGASIAQTEIRRDALQYASEGARGALVLRASGSEASINSP